MSGRRISRRRLGQVFAGLLPAFPQLARGQAFDQGIGGTGVVGDPKDEPSDQMIGGTGVVGTIRRFGSIYVNGLRITYPDDLPVTRDGARVGTKDLKLGQVVRVAAAEAKGELVARSIRILHEVVGPVEAVAAGSATVLGQTLSLENKPQSPKLAVGQTVAVSGLRRLDGTVVATLIEAVTPGELRVAGLLIRSPGGALTIGGVSVVGVDPALVDRRVYVAGHKTGAKLVATDSVAERTALTRLATSRLSLEAYVSRSPTGLRLGSGLHVGGDPTASDTEELAVVTITVTDKDHLVAEKVEAVTQAEPATGPTRNDEHRTQDRDEKGEKGGPKGDKGGGGGGTSSGRAGGRGGGRH